MKPLSAYLKMPGFPVTVVHFKFFQPSQINFLKKAVINQMFNNLTVNTNEEEVPSAKKIQAKKTTQEKKTKGKTQVDKGEIEMRYEDKNGNEITEEHYKTLMLVGAESTTKGYTI